MMAFVGTLAFEFEVTFPLLAHNTFPRRRRRLWLLGAFGTGSVIGGVYAAGRSRTGVVRLGHTALHYAAALMALALWAAVRPSALVRLATILFRAIGNSTMQLASNPLCWRHQTRLEVGGHMGRRDRPGQ